MKDEKMNDLATLISYTLLFTLIWGLFLIIAVLTFSLGSQVSLVIVLFLLPAGTFLLGIKVKELSGKLSALWIWRRKK
jgi:hypothetical protein